MVTATRCAGRPGQASLISSGSSVASRSSWRITSPAGSARTSCTRTRVLGPGRRLRLMGASLYFRRQGQAGWQDRRVWKAEESLRRRGATEPHDGWTSEISSGLALAGFLFLVFVGFTSLAMGPLISLDAYFKLDPPPQSWLPFLHVLDRIGQRAVCLPILAVVTIVCCRYRSSWRPAWVVAASVFSLNLLVLILKVLLGRGQPASVDPAFFVGGIAYPSGHTANIMLVYGLAVYLLGHYRQVGTSVRRALW